MLGPGPRDTEARPLPAAPPERREGRDEDMLRVLLLVLSRSLSARSVIAMVARWAAERRGRVDMVTVIYGWVKLGSEM